MTGKPVLARPRILFALTAMLCVGLLGYGYYLQYHDGLEPCPMCVFQRLCYMAIVLFAVVGAAHGPRRVGAAVYAGLVAVAGLVGAGIAARQVWLQHLPESQVPACGPGLEYMLEMYPLAEVIRDALRGTGECASVDWTFFGASIAEWSLLWFFTIVVIHIVFMINHVKSRHPAAPA